jgi:hypothetical protein
MRHHSFLVLIDAAREAHPPKLRDVPLKNP